MVIIALLSACVTAGKMALSFIPNVHIVALLFIVYTVALGTKRSLLIALVFATTEVLLYGFATWVLGYYVIWPSLVLVTAALDKVIETEYGYAIISGIFGLTFGLFFAVFESLFYGVAYGVTYWIRGIPFDIVHGVSNFVMVLVLFKPLVQVLSKLDDRAPSNELDAGNGPAENMRL